jgi:urease accessory protein
MAWLAHLRLNYRHDAGRTLLAFEHDGPLRVLKNLYPEGPAICQNVLVHPPGGLVEGDTLDIAVHVQAGAHALISSPGATRFYRSTGAPATQQVRIQVDTGARLEWLPLETIAYNGCQARNHMTLNVAPGAELLAWDVTALGLPAADLPFESGTLHQRLHWPGVWLEEGQISATDTRLMQSPMGLAGHRCLATLVLASGTPLSATRQDQLLDAVRTAVGTHPLAASTGATCPNPHVLAVRILAPLVEPAMALCQQLRAVLRKQAWSLDANAPRIWQV